MTCSGSENDNNFTTVSKRNSEPDWEEMKKTHLVLVPAFEGRVDGQVAVVSRLVDQPVAGGVDQSAAGAQVQRRQHGPVVSWRAQRNQRAVIFFNSSTTSNRSPI